MGLQDLFNWRSQTVTNTTATTAVVAEEDLAADVDEPPDHRSTRDQPDDFHKSSVRTPCERKKSLLTQALLNNPEETSKPAIQVTTDSSRRRSITSNASLASTAELTSDGGLTSPARTNTPSPPPPGATYTSFAPYSLAAKSMNSPAPLVAYVDIKDETHIPDYLSLSPKAQPPPPVEAPPKKRCISFQCGQAKKPTPPPAVVAPTPVAPTEPPKRSCKIKFACGMKPSEQRLTKAQTENTSNPKAVEPQNKATSRSPSIPRKSPRPFQSSPRPHRDSSSTIRRASQSPADVRAKPEYFLADEKTLQSSEATRFHEFASEGVQEDDWIRRDTENPKAKLTISDILKKENAIRQLGNEAEEEALEEDEQEEDEDEQANYSDGEDEYGENDGSLDGSDDGSDGNETDNEAGFAESDDESDCEGEFAFWTPGRNIAHQHVDASTYRASAHRAASASSIDSLSHLESAKGPRSQRKPRRRPIKIRPGTPELPDSTDFVCGTLDEDRPIENAYISCMEARKNAKHKHTPQDIDPSFPTSDVDVEEDDEDIVEANDSDEHVWLHGNFEESDHEKHGRRRAITPRRKSPIHSPRRLHSPPPPRRLHSPPPPRQRLRSPPPRRLHSPPPPRQRLRSPPPRKLFGHSPKRMRSPPPARNIRSPAASPNMQGSNAINFAPLAQRPGLTHTKSLPRAPNAFGRQYRASRIVAANGNDGSDTADGHVRGAIDIVKGLERKRHCRKEKFQCNKGRKHHAERKPQPGKGAERMRELGLLMAGKTGQNPYMMSA